MLEIGEATEAGGQDFEGWIEEGFRVGLRKFDSDYIGCNISQVVEQGAGIAQFESSSNVKRWNFESSSNFNLNSVMHGERKRLAMPNSSLLVAVQSNFVKRGNRTATGGR